MDYDLEQARMNEFENSNYLDDRYNESDCDNNEDTDED